MTNSHTCLNAHDEDPITGLAYLCTRPRGHRGQHVAHDVDGVTVIATWEPSDADSLDGLLDALVTAHRDASRAVERRDRLVRLAREKGATWTVLGTILGITAQGAQKRYGSSQERVDALEARQAAKKARKAHKPTICATCGVPITLANRVQRPGVGYDVWIHDGERPTDDGHLAAPASSSARPDSEDPWPDGTVQGTISADTSGAARAVPVTDADA